MPGVMLYCSHAVSAYVVCAVSFTWRLGQAIPIAARMQPEVVHGSLWFLRYGIEVDCEVVVARTRLVVATSDCDIDLWSVVTINHLVGEKASAGKGCWPISSQRHEESKSREKSSGAIVLENKPMGSDFQLCYHFEIVGTKLIGYAGCGWIGVERHRGKRQQRICFAVTDC